MGLKDIGGKLPPGFRFHPSDEELVCHYLRNKTMDKFDHYHNGDGDDNDDHDDYNEAQANPKDGNTDLVDIDLHTCEPWQLPDVAKLNAKEWYFYNFRDRKYATGYRTNRATISGYWKATGKDRVIVDPQTKQMVGMRKTLVFYRNRAPNGIKTTWIMHEFRLESPNTPPKEDWVLCRVFNKSKESQLEDNKAELLSCTPHPNYAPNYTQISPPQPSLSSFPSTAVDRPYNDQALKLPCGWEQMMWHHQPLSSPPSSTIDYPNHNDHDQMMQIPCGWEQIMGSLSTSSSHVPQAHESLLNILYDNGVINVASAKCRENEDHNDKSVMGLDQICMGSSSSDGLVSDILLENDGLKFEI